jgi:methionine-rich copper-binding protein CopC
MEARISGAEAVHTITFRCPTETDDCSQKKSWGGLLHRKIDMRGLNILFWYGTMAILFVIASYFVSAAYGHAIVLSTTPDLHQTIHGSDVPIKIRFNSRIDAKRSRLTLLASDGKQTALRIGDASSGESLISEAKGLKSGTYVIRWQVLAVDGHITRGEVQFRVQ